MIRARRVIAEALAVAMLPLLAYFLFRLRLMPFPDLNDPAMHTTFIIDPRDIFERYSDLFTPTARLREGARVGLLVPARISYLLFGSVGGFVVFRYILALIAVGPAYVLMRRLGGVAAGVTTATVVLTCPVILTAWGTDYPDSASVSYLMGGLACLAVPSVRRTGWIAAAAALLTLSVWAFATSAVFAVAFAAVYLALRVWRERAHLVRDAAVAACVSVATTLALAVGSGLLLGQLDFITPTVNSIRFLATPSQEALWHSSSWAWAPYDIYLLVLPLIALVWLAAAARLRRSLPTSHLMVGMGFTVALIATAALQFIGQVQMLEEHYFSSLSWAGAMLTFSVLLTIIGQPLFAHPRWRWSIPIVVVAVALAYVVGTQVFSARSISRIGMAAASVLVIAVVVLTLRAPALRTKRLALLGLLISFDALQLLITVTPVTLHGPLAGVVTSPVPQYSGALGGSDAGAVDIYQVTTEIPGFVGPASYPRERLMMWWPPSEGRELIEPIGMFHAYFNSVVGRFGSLSPSDVDLIEQRRPAQFLLMSTNGNEDFAGCVVALAPFQPQVVRTGTLSSGSFTLHLWLVQLNRYSH